MNKILTRQGFSLIEVLIGMAMMAILMAGIGVLLTTGLKSGLYDKSLGMILAPGRNVLSYIDENTRYQACTISIPSAGGSGSVLTYADGETTVNTYSIYYDSTSKAVIVTKNGTVIETLGVGLVTSLNFARDSSDVRYVTITIGLKDSSNANSPLRTVSRSVVLLNVTE